MKGYFLIGNFDLKKVKGWKKDYQKKREERWRQDKTGKQEGNGDRHRGWWGSQRQSISLTFSLTDAAGIYAAVMQAHRHPHRQVCKQKICQFAHGHYTNTSEQMIIWIAATLVNPKRHYLTVNPGVCLTLYLLFPPISLCSPFSLFFPFSPQPVTADGCSSLGLVLISSFPLSPKCLLTGCHVIVGGSVHVAHSVKALLIWQIWNE